MSPSAAVTRVRLAIVTVGIVATAAPALAQRLMAPRPTVQRPLAEREHETLGVIVGVTGGTTNQDLNQSEEVTDDIPVLESAIFADFAGVVRYEPEPAGKLTLSATASSAVRRFQTGGEFMVLGHSAGASAAMALSGRTTVTTTGSFSYVPAFAINATPAGDLASLATAAGTLPPNAIDYSLTKRVLLSGSGGVGLDQSLTRRLKLGMWYVANRQEFKLDIDPSYLSQNMAARLTYSLTRGLAVRAGFGRRLTDYQTPDGVDRVALDDIDVGLVFSEAVGITRTTRFSFNTGSSIHSYEGEQVANLTASATLTQELGRRGQIDLTFSRGNELTPGFGQPVFSNWVSLSGRYDLTNKFTASFASSTSFGESGRSAAGNNKVETMSGSARLTYTLLRNVEAFGEYLAYRSNIDQEVVLIAGVPRDRNSRSIRVGIALAIPLVTRLPPRDVSRQAPERN